MSKKYWINSWEYRRIMQILEDYWLTEEHEDLVDIRMLFIKGNEYQTKQIRWIRSDTMSEEPTDLNVTNLADLMSRIDKLKEDLTKFIEHESEEMRIDEDVLWGDLWALADERFIKSTLKKYEQK